MFSKLFFDQKKAIGEISDNVRKNRLKKTTIFTKRNGFFEGYIVFLLFFDKKRTKVRFQTKLKEKPRAKTRQLLEKVTVYLQNTSCFDRVIFLTKKGQT